MAIAPDGRAFICQQGGQLRVVSAAGVLLTTPDNPFFNSVSGVNRSICALGLRNPFTFAFQQWNAVMFINDVGAGSYEEINRGIAGANYGWPITDVPRC